MGNLKADHSPSDDNTVQGNWFTPLCESFFSGTGIDKEYGTLGKLPLLSEATERDWKTISSALNELDERRTRLIEEDYKEKGYPFVALLASLGAPQRLIEQALQKGFDADAVVQPDAHSERTSFTALHCAAQVGNAGAVTVLLEYNRQRSRSSNAYTDEGKNPLQIVLESDLVEEKKWEIARLLLNAGVSAKGVPSELLDGADLRGVALNRDAVLGVSLPNADLTTTDLSNVPVDEKTGHLKMNVDTAWYSPLTKFPPGVWPSFEGMRMAQPVWNDGTKEFVTPSRKEDLYQHLLAALSDQKLHDTVTSVRAEAELFALDKKDIAAGLLYGEVHRLLILSPHVAQVPVLDEFIRVAMAKEITPKSYAGLLHAVDQTMEGKGMKERYAHLPELLVLCDDPRLNFSDPGGALQGKALSAQEKSSLEKQRKMQVEQLAPYTLAITSIYGWGEAPIGAKASLFALSNWGQIGRITRSFIKLKFDTKTLEDGSSLIEKFGLIRNGRSDFVLEPGSKHVEYLENGEKKDIDPDTALRLTREGIFISSPRGTTFIRNSSPSYGRNLFEEVAVWSPLGVGNGMSMGEFLELDRNDLRSSLFTSVFDPSLHVPTRHIDSQGKSTLRWEEQLKIGKDLSETLGLFQAISAWKFDTRRDGAWRIDETGADQLIGAYLSEGFGPMVNALHQQAQKVKGDLSLAIVPSDFAALWSVPFEDENGFARHALPVTPERLEVLHALARGRFEVDEVRDAGLLNFLQTSLTVQGEVIVLYPEDNNQ